MGVSPVACIDIVPAAVARLKRETPNIVIAIDERADDELIAGLQSGEIDLVVNSAGLLADGPDVICETLARDVFVVAMRSGHRLAGRKSLLIVDLRDEQWVMPGPHTTMSRQVELLFSAEESAVAVSGHYHQLYYGAEIHHHGVRVRNDFIKEARSA